MLDNTTFDKIVDGSRAVIVRFDKEYAYGDEHDADIAERFSIKTDDFPQYRLWLKGSGSDKSPVVYSGEKKSDAFLRFVQEKAGVWIGLPGQVKELDAIAKKFGTAADKTGLVA